MKLIDKRKNYTSKQQKVFKLVDTLWIEIGALDCAVGGIITYNVIQVIFINKK